ncbi:hypothetical protein FA09DRAFT_63167 [Tilletiopsis washingtonensis]|uniref:Uncharacterized protein n=1 Tax=Tilletiopsis washingtonensis TaxID=58919 RepID=A0A316Z5V6_9BASI|nr:hypothetical protein FA09DRAFT_63167 [Tilletiopsis washingtonensis]PWN97167.1 hypothetical protein FA09DRAFT_63167 [Tilletiopsis washingtonensis]
MNLQFEAADEQPAAGASTRPRRKSSTDGASATPLRCWTRLTRVPPLLPTTTRHAAAADEISARTRARSLMHEVSTRVAPHANASNHHVALSHGDISDQAAAELALFFRCRCRRHSAARPGRGAHIPGVRGRQAAGVRGACPWGLRGLARGPSALPRACRPSQRGLEGRAKLSDFRIVSPRTVPLWDMPSRLSRQGRDDDEV